MPNNYRRYDPEREPWWQGTTPGPSGSEQDRRYERARRLSQFARDVARGPTVMMSPALIAYRQQCLDRWQEYMDGWAPPMPKRDNGRPPKLRS